MVRVLIRRRASSFSRSIACVVRTDFQCAGSSRGKVKSRSPAFSRLSATALRLSRHLRRKAFRRVSTPAAVWRRSCRQSSVGSSCKCPGAWPGRLRCPTPGKMEARKELRMHRADEERIKAAAAATGLQEADFIRQATLLRAQEVEQHVSLSVLPVEAFDAFKAAVEAPGQLVPACAPTPVPRPCHYPQCEPVTPP